MAKPVFSAVAAVTLDGRIAAHPGQNTTWTSLEDKKFLHRFLDQSDVILVGHATYQIAKSSLLKRNCIVLTSKARRTNRKTLKTLFVNPKSVKLIDLIKQLGYKKIAVLGGQKIYSFCLQRGLLDELYLTIEPIVFGQGLGLFELKRFKQSQKFKLAGIRKLNSQGSILLHYKLLTKHLTG
ncbi:MAG: dihydrofolate reductase family protein [Candidatus Doudnabacteria bacterium]|nr:dihydrofolate reductase family protein [Candidatus Doudnabacteria bacterium]